MGQENKAGQIFRAPMRARSLDPDLYMGAKLGVERGIVGIGEPLPRIPVDAVDAIRQTGEIHGEKAARMLGGFMELPNRCFLWTRVMPETYRLGQFNGPWYYDTSEAAGNTGIHQVRPVIWHPKEFDSDSAPPVVINTFRRGGRNFQRIRDGVAEQKTHGIWRRFRA